MTLRIPAAAHKTPAIRAAIAARSWLRVYQLPAYAPELNPVEKVWSTMKGSLANLAVRTANELAAAVKNRLKRMQYRTGLIDGYFTEQVYLSRPRPDLDHKRSLLATPSPAGLCRRRPNLGSGPRSRHGVLRPGHVAAVPDRSQHVRVVLAAPGGLLRGVAAGRRPANPG